MSDNHSKQSAGASSGYPASDTPVIPLPNVGEGGPVYSGNSGSDSDSTPVVPLPNPGEGGPVYSGSDSGSDTSSNSSSGSNGWNSGWSFAVWPGMTMAKTRFLNAAYGYPAFQIYVSGTQVVSLLNYAAVSPYRRFQSGYRTVTVTGTNGYVYLQKTIPFEANSTTTVAVINRAGGLDLLQISDRCCPPTGSYANFRVSNLAYNSGALDVLLADGRVVYADVQFKETTSYKRIRPGTYEFLFAETNLMPSPSYTDIETLDSAFLGTYPVPDMVASAYLTVSRNANYTVFLLNNGTAANAIQTMVVEDQ